jgi:large subunit ribosomal protein L35
MPKMKSNSSSKKRFKATGTGKVKRHHARASHILTKKSRKMKKRLNSSAIVDPSNMNNIRKLVPYL